MWGVGWCLAVGGGICTEDDGSADLWECMSNVFLVGCGVLILPEFKDCISDDRAIDEQEDGVGGSVCL